MSNTSRKEVLTLAGGEHGNKEREEGKWKERVIIQKGHEYYYYAIRKEVKGNGRKKGGKLIAAVNMGMEAEKKCTVVNKCLYINTLTLFSEFRSHRPPTASEVRDEEDFGEGGSTRTKDGNCRRGTQSSRRVRNIMELINNCL